MGDARGGTGWERLFWLVFERTSNPVVLLDETRRIVEVNPAAAELLGGPREQLVGVSLRDRLDPAQREAADAEWRDFLRTGEYSGTRDLLKTDGGEFRADFAARMADIGGRRMAIFVAMAGGESEPAAIARGAANLGLTDREREVVTLIAMGLDTGEIAAELHISPETVRTHVRNAMAKLNVHTRAQLVAVVLCSEQTLHDGHLGTAERGGFSGARCRASPSAAPGSARPPRPRPAPRVRAPPAPPRPARASSAPSASASRSRVRAPTSGTISSPRASTQAIASCATVAPRRPATARSASTSSRLRSTFPAAKRGARERKSLGGELALGGEVAADQAAAQHAVGRHGDAQLAAGGQDRRLDPARDQRVLELHVADRVHRGGPADRLGADLGEADVAHVAGLARAPRSRRSSPRSGRRGSRRAGR